MEVEVEVRKWNRVRKEMQVGKEAETEKKKGTNEIKKKAIKKKASENLVMERKKKATKAGKKTTMISRMVSMHLFGLLVMLRGSYMQVVAITWRQNFLGQIRW